MRGGCDHVQFHGETENGAFSRIHMSHETEQGLRAESDASRGTELMKDLTGECLRHQSMKICSPACSAN